MNLHDELLQAKWMVAKGETGLPAIESPVTVVDPSEGVSRDFVFDGVEKALKSGNNRFVL